MKKILSLLAIVATVVISAVSFVSCTSKDDSPIQDVYKFSVVITTQSTDQVVLAGVETANKRMSDKYSSKVVTGDEQTGNISWYDFTSNGSFQSFINDLSKTLSDKSLVLKAAMLKNGKEYKTQEYKPYLIDL